MTTAFHEGIPDALRGDAGVLGDREVHDPPRVGVERPDLLWLPGGPRALGQQPGRLPQLRVLVLPVVEAVDHDMTGRMLAPEGGVHDVLQRVEPRRAPLQEDVAALPGHGDAGPVLDRLDRDLESQAHGGSDVTQEACHPSVEIACHSPLPLRVLALAGLAGAAGRRHPADRKSNHV